ncbi:MAG TPA: TetR family transcriptional regulator [Acidimicrobiia bacterium]|nr:TetR family transcriptional regulator [Acidimicrobiia bacterium]
MTATARQAPVSADRIVDTALEIVDRDGPDGLTMRALAAKLGVAVTAIYWHVGDKDALLAAIADRVATEVGTVRVSGADPIARIVSLGRSLRRNLLERAHLVGVAHRQGRTEAVFQPARRVLVRELVAAGLRGEDAAFAVQSVLYLVSGSVLTDLQVERAPESRDAPEELWTPADVADAPELLEYLAEPIDTEQLFTRTLETLVMGFLAPTVQPTRRSS